MANYVSALGKLAAEKTSSAVSGFARGAKGAFFSEMPGVMGASNFISTLKKQVETQSEGVKQQKISNVMGSKMVGQLRNVNESVRAQNKFAADANRRAAKAEAFAEEAEREKVLRDEKLLNEIKRLREAIEKLLLPKGEKDKFNPFGLLAGLAGLIPRGLLRGLDFFKRGLVKLIDFFKGIPNFIRNLKMPDIPKFLNDLFTRIFTSFKNIKLPDAPRIFNDLFTRIFEPFKNIKLPITAAFFSDLFNRIFEPLKNIKMTNVSGIFTDLFDKIFSGLKSINPFKDTGVLKAFEDIFKSTGEIFNEVKSSATKTFNNMRINFAIIGDEFDDLVKTLKESKVGQIANEVGTAIKQFGTDFIRNFTGARPVAGATGAVDALSEFGPIATTMARGADVADAAGDISKIAAIVKYVKEFFSGIGKTIGESFKFLGELTDITPFLKTVGKVLGPISVIFSIFDGLAMAFDDEKLKTVLNKDKLGVVDRVTGFISGFIGGFFDIFDLIGKAMGIESGEKSLGERAREFTAKGVDRIFTDLGNLFQAIGNIFNSEPMKYIYDVIGNLFSVGIDASLNSLSNLIKFITAIVTLDFKQITLTGSDLVSSITTGVANIFKVVGNVLIDGMNFIIGQINRLPGVSIGLLSKFDIGNSTTDTTSGGRQELPSGVRPSTAGGGRGSFAMPVATAEPGVDVVESGNVTASTEARTGFSLVSQGRTQSYTEEDLRNLNLNIKKGDVQRPGAPISTSLIDVAQQVQDNISGVTFTGFNDRYHEEKAPNSLHRQGMAFDFVIPRKDSTNDAYRAKIAKDIASTGARVIDEYARPSAHSTGGHFHVDLKGAGVDLGGGKFGGGPVSGDSGIKPLRPPEQYNDFGNNDQEDKLPEVTAGDPMLAMATAETDALSLSQQSSNDVEDKLNRIEINTRIGVNQDYKHYRRVEQQRRDQMTAVPGSQRPVETDPVQKYYQDRIISLTKEFEDTTRNLINTSLTTTLFPGRFFGINRRDAEQPGYLGNLIGKELELQKRMTPFFNKLVGKQFGGQYASIFGQAGNLLIDKGANFLGSMIPFQNDAFSFQQIVGNLLTKGPQGKKARKLGIEQLIYGMTGIPVGAQSGLTFLQRSFPTLFGKDSGGYMTPEQQISALSNTFTGGMMGFLQPGMLFNQGLTGAMNMIPGRQVSGIAGQPSQGGLLDFIFGPSRAQSQDDNIYGYAPVGANTGQGSGFFSTLATNISNFFKPTTYNGERVASGIAAGQKIAVNNYDELYSGIGDSVAEGQTGAFAGLGSIFAGGIGFLGRIFDGVGGGLGSILNWGFNLLAGLFGGGGGGGGLFGGGGGGDGFFSDLGKAWSGDMSWGDALLNTGMKIGGNLATNYLAYQITKNIKNPFAKFAAQQGVNYALKSGLQFAAGSFGYGDIASKFLGKDTGLTTALKTGDFSSLNPFSSAGSSSAGYNLAGEAGLKTGVNLTMPGGTSYNDFASSSTDAITNYGGYGGMDIGTTSLSGAVTSGLTDTADIALSGVLEGGAGSIASSGADLLTGGVDAITANVLGNTGQIASSVGDAAALGMDGSTASSFLGDLPGVGNVLPYAGAIVKLFQGDIKGAAISAGVTYAVNSIAQFLNIGFPGLGLVAGFVANALIGKADPRCTWAIYVNGNSDPSAGSIISEGKKTPGSMKDATTKIGIMLFAIVKKAQITVNGPLAYDYFTISMHGKSKTSTVGVGKGEFKAKGNKEVITVSLDEISTAQGMNKVTQALVNAMLEETSAEKKSAALASTSKLTKTELETGVVAGAGEEFKSIGGTTFATKFEKNLNEQFNSGRSIETVSSGEDTYTREVIGTRQVWNEKLGKVVDEPNPLIMGYNKEGQAVDLKGNVVDFSAFSTAAGFKDSFGVQEAYTREVGGDPEGGGGYVEAVARQVFNAKTGKFQDEDNPNIIGYDRSGNAIGPGPGAAVAATGTAIPVASGTTLSFQQQQATNDALKNSNPTTATNAGDTAAVVNSGNQINNSTNTTVVNTSLRDEGFMFGATRRSEFAIIPGVG